MQSIDAKCAYPEGAVVKLEGTDERKGKAKRQYIGTVIKSEKDKLVIRIGEAWTNLYHFRDGKWVPAMRKPGRKVPRTRVVGVVAHDDGVA